MRRLLIIGTTLAFMTAAHAQTAPDPNATPAAGPTQPGMASPQTMPPPTQDATAPAPAPDMSAPPQSDPNAAPPTDSGSTDTKSKKKHKPH